MRKSRIPFIGGQARARAEAAEHSEAANPEAAMRRREFLGRTAALAGAAGLATTLPAESLIGRAANQQTRTNALPSPQDLPIDHFVILMQENRSFDHYFGWHPDADAVNDGLAYPDPDGNLVPTHHLPPDYQGCGHPDPAHGWSSGRFQYGGGEMDGFVMGNSAGTGSDEFAAGYYLKEDVGFLPHAADAYQLYDRFFHSILASTYPNRHYMMSAQNGGQKGNVFPPQTEETLGFQWETIFDRALANDLSARYYVSDLPFAALYGARGMSWVDRIETYYAQAATGTLPNISFVDPPFRDGGGGDGVSADEHPHGDIRLGQAFVSDVVHAFMESPNYERGALFIVYDEWGGFFDHVPPRIVPDDRANHADVENDWGLSGFRIPAVVVSPFTRSLGVSHATCMFESILKLISYRFKLGHLTKRHRFAYNIGRTFNWASPDFEVPDVADPGAVLTAPCAAGGSEGVPDPTGGGGRGAVPLRGAQEGERPKDHDMALLETTGLLDRLGYEVRRPTYDSLFREPDRIRKAAAEAKAAQEAPGR